MVDRFIAAEEFHRLRSGTLLMLMTVCACQMMAIPPGHLRVHGEFNMVMVSEELTRRIDGQPVESLDE